MSFCPRCGTDLKIKEQVISFPQSPEQQKKSGKKVFLSLLIFFLVMLVLFGSGTAYALFKNKNLNNQWNQLSQEVEQHELPKYIEQRDGLVELWKSKGLFLFVDGEELLFRLQDVAREAEEEREKLKKLDKQYKGYVDKADKFKMINGEKGFGDTLKKLETALENKEREEAEKALKDIEEKHQKLKEELNKYIEGRVETFRNVDFTYADSKTKTNHADLIHAINQATVEEEYSKINEMLIALEEVSYLYLIPDKQLDITVSQIDASSYPKVRLYLRVNEVNSKEVPANLDKTMFFIRKMDANSNYIKQTIERVNQLNEGMALNINMVMDVSGSMEGNPLNEAKQVMSDFIQTVQFHSGDQVELTSFSTGVQIVEPFSRDANQLIRQINSLYTDNMTSLYDALYASVTRVASQSGAKCVIAFTDGNDNYSNSTPQDVITLSKRYHVPIFIIGIGADYSYEIENIATETGGKYYNIYSFASMQDIYQQIYQEEKELFLLEFTDSEKNGLLSQSNIIVGYQTPEYGGRKEFTYQPKVLLQASGNALYKDGPEAVVEKYMKGFAHAMTQSNYSFIEPYLRSGSNIAKMQQAYVKKNIAESLDSYEIVDVKYLSNEQCHVTTRETYYVQIAGKPLKLLTQQCKYNLVKDSSGWLMTDFAENVKVLSNIHQ